MLGPLHVRRDSGERRDPRGIPPREGWPAAAIADRRAGERAPWEKKGKRSHEEAAWPGIPTAPARRRDDGRPVERKSRRELSWVGPRRSRRGVVHPSLFTVDERRGPAVRTPLHVTSDKMPISLRTLCKCPPRESPVPFSTWEPEGPRGFGWFLPCAPSLAHVWQWSRALVLSFLHEIRALAHDRRWDERVHR